MIADPFTVAANAPTPALVMAITRSDGYGSERVDTGGNGYATVINHQPGKNGDRHYFKLSLTKDATNPYSGLVQKQVASVSVSFSVPAFGFTTVNMVDLWEAVVDCINDAEVTATKLLQFQS